MKRIGLVGCGEAKARRACPAREMYVSTLFRLASAYCEREYDAWFILSAEHGLLHPDKVIEPYDKRLPGDHAGRRAWGNLVSVQLIDHCPAGTHVKLYVHAGADYASALATWRPIEEPLKGLTIGRRNAWYKARLAEQQIVARPITRNERSIIVCLRVEPWPNGLGHKVYLDEDLIAEVFDPPQRRGLKVTTFLDGKADLAFDHPFKVDPVTAVGLCYVLGKPHDEHSPSHFNLAELRQHHGEHAVLLLDYKSDVRCLPDQRERLLALGIPEVFPHEDLPDHSHRLSCEGLKVVVCPMLPRTGAGAEGGAG